MSRADTRSVLSQGDRCDGPGCTRNHGIPVTASILHCYESWLEEHLAELPHTEIGKARSFSHEDIAEIQVMKRVRPPTATAAEPAAAPPALASLRPSGRARRSA